MVKTILITIDDKDWDLVTKAKNMLDKTWSEFIIELSKNVIDKKDK